MTTHVVVIGAGIVGLAAARELALRGARVTVVERHVAGAGTSSRGEGNILVSDKEIPAEARLALRSIELWRAFAEASPEPFEFEPKGGIITASSPAQLDLLAAQADRQKALGIESAVLDRDAGHLTRIVTVWCVFRGAASDSPPYIWRCLLLPEC